MELRLIFIQAGDLPVRYPVVVAQDRDARAVDGIRHQEGKPLDIIGKPPVMGPPDVGWPHVRRPLLLPFSLRAVIKGMGDEQVHPADGQPVDVPDHVPSGEMPVIRPPAAHAEAFVGVSASAQVPGDIRAQLRLYGIRLQKPSCLRRNPAQDQILTRNVKIQLLLHVVAGLRMAHERDVMRLTPAGKPGIKDFPEMLFDQPVIKRRRPVFLSRKKPFQLRKAPSAFGKFPLQPRRPFPVRGGVAPQRAGLIREKGDDGVPEVFLQLLIIAVMGQPDKGVHRVRVQDIRRLWRARLPVILPEMNASYGSPGKTVDQVFAVRKPGNHLPALRLIGKADPL